MISVGIDVAKDKHDCFIISSEGEVLVDVFTIPNNMDGFHCLLEKIQPLAGATFEIRNSAGGVVGNSNGISQLSDRYEKKEREELIGNCDIQICLGCNDQMTAQYISDKCGQITIRVNNNQMPLMPLFSPIYTSTRPYSQTRSNTQRALMLPDEILRMDNRQCLVLLRGQKPMQLYKIIPDELPTFQQLRETTVREHTPIWRQQPEQPTAETIVPTPTPLASDPQLQMELETQYEYGLSDRTETDELGMVEKPLCEVLGDDEEDAT